MWIWSQKMGNKKANAYLALALWQVPNMLEQYDLAVPSDLAVEIMPLTSLLPCFMWRFERVGQLRLTMFFFAVDFCMLIVSHERKQAQTLRLKGQREVLHRHFGLKCGLFFLSSASAPASFAVASHSGGSLPLSRYILALCSSPILQLLSCRTPSALTEWIEAQKDSLYAMTWVTFRRMSFFLHSTYEPHEAS